MRKILIVDDDPLMGTLYRDLLTAQEYEVTLIIDGDTALEKIKQNNWDLILLDIILPNRSGLQVIRDLQTSNPEALKQKIVFLTNIDKNVNQDEINRLGFPFLNKGQLNPDEFVNKVNELLQ